MTFLEGPIALPEKRPPKSITLRTLVRFWASACSVPLTRSDLKMFAPAEAFNRKLGSMRPRAKLTLLNTCGP